MKDTAPCVPTQRWPCVGHDEKNSLSGAYVYLLGLRCAPMRMYGPGLVYAQHTYHQWYGRDVRTYIPSYNMVLTRRTTQPTTQQAPKLPVFTPPRREVLHFTCPNKLFIPNIIRSIVEVFKHEDVLRGLLFQDCLMRSIHSSYPEVLPVDLFLHSNSRLHLSYFADLFMHAVPTVSYINNLFQSVFGAD